MKASSGVVASGLDALKPPMKVDYWGKEAPSRRIAIGCDLEAKSDPWEILTHGLIILNPSVCTTQTQVSICGSFVKH